MSWWSILVREMAHRWVGSLLTVIAVGGTCGFIVFLYTAADAAERETKRIQRVSNLRIVARDADLSAVLVDGVGEATLDEALIERLASQNAVSMNHLIAILRRKIELEGRDVLLVGIARSVPTPGRPRSPMHKGVTSGKVELGHGVAAHLEKQAGDPLELFDRTFNVSKVLLEKGSADDWTVFGDLEEFQAGLDLEGRISEVSAIECVSCQSPDEEPLRLLREELVSLAPEAQVLRQADQADSRLRQRTMVERYADWIVTALLIAAMLWTGALAMVNVRDRRGEVGVLRSVGYGTPRILAVFLGKAVALGVVGGALGAWAGTSFALARAPEIFTLTAAKIEPQHDLVWQLVLAAPLFTALAAAIPSLLAATQDPAETLQPR